ncbi:hypothetical protein DFH07DRAFT_774806 [Mycena maculata]|uniref:Uncharacterized protein n=1 Tax=Mycena maculata TaxID=230809 RepID=A0AAD7N9K5_9AGAR|nr:hypothetical protein DFH07DRAFT_774806 [Mycena maculata]
MPLSESSLENVGKGHRVQDTSGYMLLQKYWDASGLNVLKAAVQIYQEAVGLTPANHPDRAGRLQNLAMLLSNRWKRTFFLPRVKQATLGSLLDAQAKKPSSTHNKVAVDHHRANYFKGVQEEVEKICSIIEEPTVECLIGEEATLAAVENQLQSCSWRANQKLLIVLPRLGYGWLGSAFDGFEAISTEAEPSRLKTGWLERLRLSRGSSRGSELVFQSVSLPFP